VVKYTLDMENNKQEEVAKKIFSKKWLKEQALNALDLIKFMALAAVIVIPIRTFIAQPFIVSGDSMYPTFHHREYLIVDQISYNLGKINRGDVAVFKYPQDTSRYFIKRIIALPNESVSIENGRVTIYNAENPTGFILDEPYLNESFNTTAEYSTGEGEYFAMGDNRNRSSDSRVWGIVPKKNLIGRAYLRLLPVTNISHLPGEYKQ
jgi:signal peptidase I